MNMKQIYGVEDLQPIHQIRLLQAHGSNGTPHGRFEMWLAKKDELHDKLLDAVWLSLGCYNEQHEGCPGCDCYCHRKEERKVIEVAKKKRRDRAKRRLHKKVL